LYSPTVSGLPDGRQYNYEGTWKKIPKVKHFFGGVWALF
jgi:hypothetical protein